ncbi:MAG: hypothetical protein KDC44_00720 [Phaeodactylibacter sp.]|nr:hypothetical protein [Phaeodactylibacter sp.]
MFNLISTLVLSFSMLSVGPQTTYETAPVINCSAPLEAIWVDDCTIHANYNESGVYRLASTNGDSSCSCWNSTTQNYSIGKAAGVWQLFLTRDCKGVVGQVVNIQTTASCDPTEADCISEAALVVSDCTDGANLGEGGKYFRDSNPGTSTCCCWTHESKNFSIGKVAGAWYLYPNTGCQQSGNPVRINAVDGCDPSGLSCAAYGNPN